jgi:glucokinase
LNKDIVIGMDIGGTVVRLGAFTCAGEPVEMREAPIEAARGPQFGLERIASLVQSVIEKLHISNFGTGTGVNIHSKDGGNLVGIGVGCTGPLDLIRGTINNPYTLPTWEDVPIVDFLVDRFGVPVSLENDADAAALGEYWQGAGRDVQRLCAVTVGTGIGTAYILHGKIVRGNGGWHPEGGHMIIDPSGPKCYCGGSGCWESLSSGSAIARVARELVQAQPDKAKTLLDLNAGDFSQITAKSVAQAARQGDSLASEVIDRAAEYFSLGIINIIMMLFPDVIVLSGGVMESFDLFKPTLEKAIRRHEVMLPANQVEILPASLGYHAGVYGAAFLMVNQ